MNFLNKSKLVIDFNGERIKIMEYNKSGVTFMAISDPMEEQPHLQDMDQVQLAQLLESLITGIDISRKTVQVVLRSSDVSIRNIQLPNMPESEMKEALLWHASSVFPFSLKEAVYDYQVTMNKELDENEVAVIAVEKGALEKYVSVLDDLGISPKVIDVPQLCQQRLLACLDLPVRCLLLDIEKSSVCSTLFQNGMIKHSRQMAILIEREICTLGNIIKSIEDAYTTPLRSMADALVLSGEFFDGKLQQAGGLPVFYLSPEGSPLISDNDRRFNNCYSMKLRGE